MKLSTKGRYGLRALIDLAVFSEEGHQSLSNIAERECISEIYLEQVFSTLRKAGIVKSIKGAQGGYLLNEPAKDLTMGRILRALEGNLSIVDEKVKTEIEKNDIIYCIYANIWSKIDDKLNALVDAVTLEDMVAEYKKMNNLLPEMYYI
ncbi:MAG: Rrf2 family transcriptional regulator [Eubacteriaceae bacterium]|nr:Rrf2 family transcriptional regulator [Eubacteriaceae bacterium]